MKIEEKQMIYGIWIKHIINSTDGRNGRNIVNISQQKYLAVYNDIDNKGIAFEEKVNKCGKKYFSAN